MRKPYPLSYQDGRKFGGKKDFFNKGQADAYATANVKEELRKPTAQISEPVQQDGDDSFHFSDDQEEAGSSFGISPRISISADGKVTVGRSMNLQRNFNQESNENEHEFEHLDEDSDHFHKIRTVRSAPESGPQQLAATLEDLKDTNTAQGINVNNGAQAGEYFQMDASGDTILASNQGSSSASGSGTIYATGTTSVTTSGSSGWRQ